MLTEAPEPISGLLIHFYDTGGVTTRSDYARSNTDLIASAACQGLISTLCPDGSWGRVWRLTVKGLGQLFQPPRVEDA